MAVLIVVAAVVVVAVMVSLQLWAGTHAEGICICTAVARIGADVEARNACRQKRRAAHHQ